MNVRQCEKGERKGRRDGRMKVLQWSGEWKGEKRGTDEEGRPSGEREAREREGGE